MIILDGLLKILNKYCELLDFFSVRHLSQFCFYGFYYKLIRISKLYWSKDQGQCFIETRRKESNSSQVYNGGQRLTCSSAESEIIDTTPIGTHPVSGLVGRTDLVWLIKGMTKFVFLTRKECWKTLS